MSFLLIAGREAAEEPLTMRIHLSNTRAAESPWLPAINEPCNVRLRTSGQGRFQRLSLAALATLYET